MTEKELLSLERKVRSLATAGQFGLMLETIKLASQKHEIPYQELCQRVAKLAIELGHVKPIQQVASLEPE